MGSILSIDYEALPANSATGSCFWIDGDAWIPESDMSYDELCRKEKVDPVAKRIIVTHLADDVFSPDLEELFLEGGLDVRAVTVVRDSHSGSGSGFGFAEFGSVMDAEKAIQRFHRATFFGRQLKVVASVDALNAEGRSRVHISGLPQNWTPVTILKHFSSVGRIRAVKLLKSSGVSKGVAFVTFSKKSEVVAAVNILHGTIIDGQVVRVCRSTSGLKLSKPARLYALFIGNLAICHNADFVSQLLEPYDYHSIKMMSIGKDCGYCFANFDAREEAVSVQQELHGKIFDGHHLVVQCRFV